MSAQDLVTKWLSEANELRASAELHRKSGMFETARGERLKADRLTDCASELQALLPAPSKT